MINHITLFVSNLEKSETFFSIALRPLGYKVLQRSRHSIGFGIIDEEGKRDFWIKTGGKKKKQHSFSCLAFTASSKQIVQIVNEFYEAALKAGGRDNGSPEYCKKYAPGYYAAFVFDLDGHNIEAVFDDPIPEDNNLL